MQPTGGRLAGRHWDTVFAVRRNRPSDLTRRAVFSGALALPAAAQQKRGSHSENAIQLENRKPGSTDWQLTNVRLVNSKGFRSRIMEGYCSHQSIEAGQMLQIMASA